MENGQRDAQQTLPGKKELKKQLTHKMETALPELRDMLGEKKFLRRVKKAAKLLMEGLHKKDIKDKKQSATAKKSAAKKATTKKAAATQGTTKTAKTAPAKKAKAAKRGNAGK